MEQKPEYAAFPQVELRDQYGMLVPYRQTGMTLRDWYIGQALAGLLANQGLTGNPELQAQNACDLANLVMQAREEKP